MPSCRAARSTWSTKTSTQIKGMKTQAWEMGTEVGGEQGSLPTPQEGARTVSESNCSGLRQGYGEFQGHGGGQMALISSILRGVCGNKCRERTSKVSVLVISQEGPVQASPTMATPTMQHALRSPPASSVASFPGILLPGALSNTY